ncbi:hypothetical protein ACLBXM_06780 [Xanthobacteraceae bacterium A53D]
MAMVQSLTGMAKAGGLALGALLLLSPAALAQSVPHIEIHPNRPSVVELPVIPQGNYLNPGPGPAIHPDVSIGDDRNEDYVFPPDLNGFDGGSPPGDPTSGGGWSPLPADTPSF